MKRILNLLCLFTMIVLAVSCKNDDGDPQPSTGTGGVVGNNSNLTVKSDQSFTKKWSITGGTIRKGTQTRLAAGAADYAWIDFSPYGVYLIMKSDGTVIDGSYTYDQLNNKIILDGFGEVVITNISTTDFTFTIIPTGETGIDLITSVGTSDGTAKTLQFARVWRLTSQTDDGVDTGILSLVDSAYVVITKYGTHMVIMKGGLLGDFYAPQAWKWSDATQASICVGDIQPDCTAEKIKITLTADNKMIAEYSDDLGVITREEYVEIVITQ